MPDDSASARRPERRRPLYELLADDIKAAGVSTVFGLTSDDTIGLVATLDAIGVEFCCARHETNAVLAAEGYSAASGKLGVAVIGRGPATANATLGIAQAVRTGSRVLVVSGAAEPAQPNAYGPDYKGYEAQAALTAAGATAFVASDPATARRLLAQAMAAAGAGTTVTLHIPASVQNAEVPDDPVDLARPTASRPRPAGSHGVALAAALLEKSRRPLILAGVGAHRAGARQTIERLGARIGALHATTLKAKDFFRGNPYDLGVFGSFAAAPTRRLIAQADCVLAFGASLNWHTTNAGASMPDVPLIHVDSRRDHVGRWHPADLALVGDAGEVAAQLVDAVAGREDQPFRTAETREMLAAHDPASEFEPAHTPRTLDPRLLAIELDRLLPERRNVIYDSGNFLMAAGYLSVPDPSCFKHTVDFSSIGCGIGTAIGFAKARPGETNVLVVGDGGLMMTLAELETAVRVDAPLVVIVFNDCAFGAELHIGRMRNLPVATSVFPDIDFAPVAAAFGYEAETIRTMDDLARVAPMLREPQGPILLDCKVNADVVAPFLAEYAQAMSRRS